jgi:hypothetical protein
MIRSKLENRGRPCVFLGVAQNHVPDVFRFLNLETKHIIVSRNVIWLNKTYGDWKNLSPSKIDYVMDDDDQDVIEQEGKRRKTVGWVR